MEVSRRMRQAAKILQRHAELAMNVPGGIIDENAQFDPETKKVFSRDETGHGAEYVAYPSELQASYAEIDRLVYNLYGLTKQEIAIVEEKDS